MCIYIEKKEMFMWKERETMREGGKERESGREGGREEEGGGGKERNRLICSLAGQQCQQCW